MLTCCRPTPTDPPILDLPLLSDLKETVTDTAASWLGYNGGTPAAASFSGGGLYFDGASYLQLPSSFDNYDWGQEITVSLLYKRTYASGYMGLISNGPYLSRSFEIRATDKDGGEGIGMSGGCETAPPHPIPLHTSPHTPHTRHTAPHHVTSQHSASLHTAGSGKGPCLPTRSAQRVICRLGSHTTRSVWPQPTTHALCGYEPQSMCCVAPCGPQPQSMCLCGPVAQGYGLVWSFGWNCHLTTVFGYDHRGFKACLPPCCTHCLQEAVWVRRMRRRNGNSRAQPRSESGTMWH